MRNGSGSSLEQQQQAVTPSTSLANLPAASDRDLWAECPHLVTAAIIPAKSIQLGRGGVYNFAESDVIYLGHLNTSWPLRIDCNCVYCRLGGDEGSLEVSWSSLHPVQLFEKMKKIYTSFPFDVFRDFMKRAGINSGYQAKPCLDPLDQDCPLTAPNKESRRPPDVGAELTGGCYGFATRYMHWPEQLVVGGATKNTSGYIRAAGGLQSMVQLMGPRDMFNYHSFTYKVHSINWSVDKAKEILEQFQRKFEESIMSHSRNGRKYQFDSYSSLGLQNIINNFSELSFSNVFLGYAFMVSLINNSKSPR